MTATHVFRLVMRMVVAWILTTPLLAAEAKPKDWVDTGRQSLQPGWFGKYNWYDAPSDGVRRIDVQPPPTPPRWDWNTIVFVLKLLAWTVAAILLTLLAYLIYRTIRARLRQRSSATDAPAEEPALAEPQIEDLPFTLDRARGDLLAEARRQYEQGNYGRAVLYLFGYELMRLDRHQVIELAKGKTNRQYLREAGRRSGMRPLVERTMVAFEDVFFGQHTLDRGRFEACWADLPQFERLLAEARP